ncbi:MAG: efflux RND transporter periplasmic adaptor subunit [Gemmatimonadota bacterium]
MNLSFLCRSGAVAVLLLVAAAIAATWWWRTSGSKEAPAYRLARIERGPITATVSASGTLNPVTSVQVGTQVSGQIKELFVDFNSVVKQGQLIARIDPETFTYRVRQAEADLEAARAAVGRAQVAMLNAKRDLDRSRELVAKNFASPADVDAKQAQYDLAAADVKSAQAVLRQREASLASARVDLARTEIRAPVNGVVIKRSVDVGQTVAASLQAPELFIIAKDLSDMQVETSIDEADVGRMRVGQPASFTVDAFPGRTFNGRVTQIRKSAVNVQNVVTYTVLVSASNEGGQLMPGMTANVRIVTDTRDSVLKAPNAALRFRPSGAAVSDAAAARPGDGPKAPTDGRNGAGQLQQFRERLVAELKLDADQQAKLDPIFAAARTRFATLRDLPEESRAKGAQAARAELRAKVDEILKPEQKPRLAELVSELGSRAGQPTRGRVWRLDSGAPKAIDVRVGLTDGTATEVSGEGIAEGTEVIVGTQGTGAGAPAQKSSPPRMFF